MSEPFTMPILGERDERGKRLAKPSSFTWPAKTEHHYQAQRNHGQSLERLRERGGLCWSELRWVLKLIKWCGDSVGEADAKAECLKLYPQDATELTTGAKDG